MEITRRAFSRGFGGFVGGAFVPSGKVGASVLPTEPGFDDAYEKLLSEYIRVEEAAIAAGRTSSAGAATWEGRQLEGFIAELDGRVDIKATARQIYSEFKERFREAARQAREKLQDELKECAEQNLEKIDRVEQPDEAGPQEGLVEPRAVSGQPDYTEADGDDARLT